MENLRITPGMAACPTDHEWGLEELEGLLGKITVMRRLLAVLSVLSLPLLSVTIILWVLNNRSSRGLDFALTHPASSSTGEATTATRYELWVFKGWISFLETSSFQTNQPSPGGISELGSIPLWLATLLTAAPPIVWLVLRLRSKRVPPTIQDFSN
ncbi:MAG TPA: hypothetical protein VIM11_06830 [Tepidisphaeraceae bacterium]